MHRSFVLLAIAATQAALPSSAAARRVADTGYAKSEAMVPMRDGVKLRVVILAPHAAAPLPMLLQRTPYSRRRDRLGASRQRSRAGRLHPRLWRHPRPLPL